MSTLAEIEAAVERLPIEEKKELLRFLAARLPEPAQTFHAERPFPLSHGRRAFGSEEVSQIETAAQ